MKLFQLDNVELLPSEQIGAHSQAAWELVLLLKGTGMRTIGNMTQPMREGELILIPPHITHCWKFEGTEPIANISITFPSSTLTKLIEFCPEMSKALKRFGDLQEAVEYNGDIKRNVTAIIHDMCELPEILRLPRFIEILLLLNDMSATGSVGRQERSDTPGKKFERFRVYCRCNYMRQITLYDVSTHLGMNKSAVCTFIKKHTGMTFSAYLNDIRLDKVEELIQHRIKSEEHVTISEIAYRAGFQTIPYFNTCFSKRYGCSPSNYIKHIARGKASIT